MVAALSPTSLPGLLIRVCGVLGWARLWVPALFLLSTGFPDPAHTQVTTSITPSGTIGTVITQSGTTYNITGGTRPGGGPNLFHSFGQFSIGAADTARFNNAPAIATSNILSRVTGGNPSNIFGTIDTLTYPGATLWLINPAGVVFGPTATLNVAGSVNIATADYLRTTDGARYFADLGKTSTLSMTPVAAFGFLGPNPPTAVRVKGSTLAVSAGQTLSLIGGSRTLVDTTEAIPVPVPPGVTMAGGRLSSSSGRVNVVSLGTVANAGIGGEVVFTGSGLTATVTPIGFSTLGTILLDRNAQVDTSGNPGGTIFMRGGQLTLDGNQDSPSLPNTSLVSQTTGATNHSTTAPSMDLVVDGLLVQDGATLAAGTRSTGAGGEVRITADGVVIFTGVAFDPVSGNTKPSGIFGHAFGEGDWGAVTILAGDLEVLAGASIDATKGPGLGRSGDITLSASGQILFDENFDPPPGSLCFPLCGTIRAQSVGSGGGGQVTLSAATISITGGAIIDTITQPLAGPPSDVALLATDRVLIQGLLQNPSGPGPVFSGVFSDNFSSLTGGSISVSTRILDVTDFGILTASNAGPGPGGPIRVTATERVTLSNRGGLDTLTVGDGPGGTLSVSAPNIEINNGGFLRADTHGQGDGGLIQVTASETFTMVGGLINNLTTGSGTGSPVPVPGNGGPTRVSAPTVSMLDSDINSETFSSGHAGDIIIQGDTVDLSVVSRISNSSRGTATGNAGQIIIQGLGGPGTVPTTVTLASFSLLTTAASGTGEGGSISIGAGSALNLSNASISANVNNGAGGQIGNISLTAPTVTMAGGSITAATTGTRSGGDLAISAGNLSLGPGSIISAQSTGPGDAGTIVLTSDNTILLNGGAVTTTAAQASGGAITLTAGYMTRLINSQITSSVEGGTATRGGDITLDPQFVILQNSQILAQAFQGNGGNITIVAGVLLADPNTVIDASSQLGVSGSVNLQAPIQNLSGALVPLRQPLVQVAMSGDRCAASPTGQMSSFVQAGRDGVPPEPGTFLSSPLSLEDLEATPPKRGQGAVRPPARLGQSREPAAGVPVSASPVVLVARCSS